MNKQLKIALVIILICVSILVLLGFAFKKESKRTQDFKTVEEWAIHYAEEDFLSIRESDSSYYYTIEKLNVVNTEKRTNAQFVAWYEVKMVDIQGDEEKYIVVIEYNLDDAFFQRLQRTLVGGELKHGEIGEQHIVWKGVYENEN